MNTTINLKTAKTIEAINSIWSIVGYTVLLCFTLFKTGSVARSILGAH